MDQIKIGKFISDTRKKLGLTQKQLADLINVTDKTISKWETGNRMPDASILLELAAVLKVDVNELLAGEAFVSEDFSPEEYIQKSEHNIVGLIGELNDIDKKRKKGNFGTIVGIVFIGLAYGSLFGSSLWAGSIMDFFDFPTLLYLLGLKFLILSTSGWFPEYLDAWKACIPGRKKLSDIEPAIQAIKYAGDLTLALGAFIALLSLFSLLNYMNHSVSIGHALAQIILSLLYAAILKTVYIILLYRLKQTALKEKPKGESV